MVLFGSSGPNKEYDLTSASESLLSSFSWDSRSKPEKLEYALNLTCRLSCLSRSLTLVNSTGGGVVLNSQGGRLFSGFWFINWFFLYDWLLYTGLCSWLNGGSSLTFAQTTSLFNRVSLDSVFDSRFPGFHLGSTYSGTFHTEGGGLGGSLSLPSDCDRCLARYCIVKTGEPGTLREDLGTVEESSFLVGLEESFVFPESDLWRREFCVEKKTGCRRLLTLNQCLIIYLSPITPTRLS